DRAMAELALNEDQRLAGEQPHCCRRVAERMERHVPQRRVFEGGLVPVPGNRVAIQGFSGSPTLPAAAVVLAPTHGHHEHERSSGIARPEFGLARLKIAEQGEQAIADRDGPEATALR